MPAAGSTAPDAGPDLDLDRLENASFHHCLINSKTEVRLVSIQWSPTEHFHCTLKVIPVHALAAEQYCALSYTWGGARTPEDIDHILIDKQHFYIRKNLYSFFRAYREFGAKTWIYIDAICIDQSDDSERSDQVVLMPQIYENANLTYVWLGEPLVKDELMIKRLQSQFSQRVAVSDWPEEAIIGLSYLCSRDYWRRLWIVQELLLSETVEVHCGASKFYLADLAGIANLENVKATMNESSMNFWASWNIPRPKHFLQQKQLEDVLYAGWDHATRLFLHHQEWLDAPKHMRHGQAPNPGDNGFPFHRAIKAFSRQNCSDRRDRVFALLGITNRDGKAMIRPDYNTSPADVFVKGAAAGLVSRWKAQGMSRSRSALETMDIVYCNALRESLDLPDSILDAKMQEALDIATSYMVSKDIYNHQDHSFSMEASEPQEVQIQERTEAFGDSVSCDAPEYGLIRSTYARVVANLGDDARAFAMMDRGSLERMIGTIQHQQQISASMMNLRRIAKLVDILDQYSKEIDRILELNIVAYVWGSMRFLLKVSSALPAAFDNMLSLWERLGTSMPLWDDIQSTIEGPERPKIVSEIFRDVLVFHDLAMTYFKKPAWKQLFPSSWPELEAKLNLSIETISDVKEGLCNMSVADEVERAPQGSLAHTIHLGTVLSTTTRARMQRENRSQQVDAEEYARRRTHLSSWLSAADVMEDQERHAECRENDPQSGKWLLDDPSIQTWLYDATLSRPALWITGKPGAGKSVFASLLVDESQECSDVTTVFFYCKGQDPERRTFVGLARSILSQLLRRDDTLQAYLFRLAKDDGGRTLGTIRLAEKALKTCLSATRRTHVIIDGIDECPKAEQSRIIKFWLSAVKETSSEEDDLRCILLSQDDEITRKLFGTTPSIRLEGRGHAANISSYCHRRACEFQRELEMSNEQKDMVAEAISLRANGMFLYARLVMDNLSEQLTKDDIRAEMAPEKLPVGLDAVYARIIDRILVQASAPYAKRARILLGWITCASRILNWREIQAAISFNAETQSFDYDGRHLSAKPKQICGALVEESPKGNVSFIHSTVKRYLLNTGLVQAAKQHASLAELSLRYFALPAFSSDCSMEAIDAFAMEGTYAFMEYAMVAWTYHLARALDDPLISRLPQGVIDALRAFFECHWKVAVKRCNPTNAIKIFMEKFGDLDIHDQVRESMSSMHFIMTTNLADTDDFETLNLFAIVARIRGRLEAKASLPQEIPELKKYYGTQLYKCSRIYCKWYHEGFSTGEQKKLHTDKHDRPHYCNTAGCVYTSLGFATAPELTKHVKERHDLGLADDDFPEEIEDEDLQSASRNQPGSESNGLEATGSARAKKKKKPSSRNTRDGLAFGEDATEFPCAKCAVIFPQIADLIAHLKHDHPEQPFVCDRCARAFDRVSGLARHHDQRHSAERRYVCEGKLLDGSTWGCGRRFARRDALKRHQLSQLGLKCTRLALAEAQTTSLGSSPSDQSDPEEVPGSPH